MNNNPKTLLLSLATALVVLVGSVYGGTYPLGWKLFDFQYERVERYEAGDSSIYDYQLGLYNKLTFQYPTESLSELLSPGSESINLFVSAAEDFLSQKGEKASTIESVVAGFSAHPANRIYLFSMFSLDEELAEDPAYEGKKWRGLAGQIDQAFGKYSSENFNLTIGRFGSFWGVRKSLVFSSDVPLDGIEYNWKWGKLTLSYRLARLDGLNPDSDSVSIFENRYTAAHRWIFILKAIYG